MKDSWNELTIGNEINFLGGFPFSSSKFNEEGIGVPLIRIRDLLNSSQVTYYSGSYSNTYLINKNEVLIGMDGDFHLVRWINSPSLLNQRILKVSGKKSSEIDIDYLFYYLKPFLLDVHNKTAATTVKHLSTFDVSRAVDLFPPLPQQKKIAKILSTVDTVIEQTETVIAKYQGIKKGLMHDLFTRGIDVNTGLLRPTPEEAPELYKESELGLIPLDWGVKRVDEIGRTITGNTPATNNSLYYDGNIMFISPADLFGQKNIVYTQKKITTLGLSVSRDIPAKSISVVCIGSTIGKVAMTSELCASNQQINSIIPFDIELSDFLFYSSKQFLIHQLFIEAGLQAVPIVNKSTFDTLKVLVPNKKKESIFISSKLSSLELKIQTEQEALAKYQQLKAGLMQDLLTGRVGVSVE